MPEIWVEHNTYLIDLFHSPVASDILEIVQFSIDKTLNSTKMMFIGELSKEVLDLNHCYLRDIILINSPQRNTTDPHGQGDIPDPTII